MLAGASVTAALTQGTEQAEPDSAEIAEAMRLVGGVRGKPVLALGEGAGAAAQALADGGAARVYVLTPGPADGQGATGRIDRNQPIETLNAVGEEIPLSDTCMDVVYAWRGLGDSKGLDATVREIARILRPGGVLLAGGEPDGGGAAERYQEALRGAGLEIVEPDGPAAALARVAARVPGIGTLVRRRVAPAPAGRAQPLLAKRP
jgi:ubiquinone/menaquinone biosynthesis C-methylase UbiE